MLNTGVYTMNKFNNNANLQNKIKNNKIITVRKRLQNPMIINFKPEFTSNLAKSNPKIFNTKKTLELNEKKDNNMVLIGKIETKGNVTFVN